MKNRLFFLSLGLDFLVFLILLFGGLSAALKSYALHLSDQWWLVNGVYIMLLSLILYCAHFPISVFSGYFWEHKFQLSTQKFVQWFMDEIKKSLIGLFFIIIFIECLYLFLKTSPSHWWISAGVLWIFLSVVIAKLTPNVIIPLFYKYAPIENDTLRQKITTMFKMCNVALKDVYSINFSSKTKKANAFLCGLGKNRRVVLSDTLLEKFSDEEIEVVIAHELAHYKHKDIIKLLIVNSAMIFIGLYIVDLVLKSSYPYFNFDNIYDIAAFPLLALVLMAFSFIMTPLQNAYSRRIENQADRFSLQTTKKRDSFISLMKKLAEMNLSELEPSRFIELFLYDHPPISKRIQFAANIKL